MPGGDRTGPRGAGPRTGRAAGLCAGFPVPGYLNPGWGGARWGAGPLGGYFGGGWGLGWRAGWGMGRGIGWAVRRGPGRAFGRGFGVDEGVSLKEEAEALRERLGAIEARLEELAGQEKGKGLAEQDRNKDEEA